MSALKRFSKSTINWAKLSERMHNRFAKELDVLAKQHGQYWATVVSKPADLTKYNFAELKKEMPEHAATLDMLQKQYESISIPYGAIPEQFKNDAKEYQSYHEARMDFFNLWAQYTNEKIKETEEKFARAPPVEHMSRDHFPEFFPTKARDYRFSEHAFFWDTSIFDIDDPVRKKIDRAYEIGHDDYQGFTSLSLEKQREKYQKSAEHMKGRYVHPWVPKELVPPE